VHCQTASLDAVACISISSGFQSGFRGTLGFRELQFGVPQVTTKILKNYGRNRQTIRVYFFDLGYNCYTLILHCCRYQCNAESVCIARPAGLAAVAWNPVSIGVVFVRNNN